MSAIEIRGLTKTYRKGFTRKRVDAVRGIDLDVEKGEAFGFLGPNGAGKTTTIRMLMDLIRPSAGHAKILGHPTSSPKAKERLGFVPEAPYFYDYLSVAELLDFTGRLFGLSSRVRKKRADELISLVGLEGARRSPIKSYSKGMMQRAGIAQALINDPELVVFDEPMSGLDPIGRKQVRDIVLGLRDEGKTIFFSSHILSDVEAIADRIAILVRGKVHDVGKLRDVVTAESGTEVVLRLSDAKESELASAFDAVDSRRRQDQDLILTLPSGIRVGEWLRPLVNEGVDVVSVSPIHETLEDVFVRAAQEEES